MKRELSETGEQCCCPLCSTALQARGDKISTDELFAMWKPVEFRAETFAEHRLQSKFTRLYVCPACELGIFYPQIIGTPNFYADLLNHEACYRYSDEKWDFEEALQDVKLNKPDSVIEIGCGPGNFLEKVKPYVAQACGTEYNEKALSVARSKGLEVFGIADETFAKMKGQFDVAFSFHVLEHVSDPIEFVEEMLSWIKPGGKIGISVPNMDGPVKYINPCVSNMPPHHATLWKLKTFKMLAERLGLKIERVAFEPLPLQMHSYYSVYWVNNKFPGKSFVMKMARVTFNKSFCFFFKILSLFGKSSTELLKGQSIYVLFSK